MAALRTIVWLDYVPGFNEIISVGHIRSLALVVEVLIPITVEMELWNMMQTYVLFMKTINSDCVFMNRLHVVIVGNYS